MTNKIKWLGVGGVFFGFILSLFAPLSVLGLTMLLVAQRELAKRYDDPELYTHFLYFLGAVATALVILSSIVVYYWYSVLSSFQYTLTGEKVQEPSKAVIFTGILIGYALLALGLKFLKSSIGKLSEYTGVEYFNWGILTLWVALGLAVISLAWLPLFSLTAFTALAGWSFILVGYYMMEEPAK